MNITFGEQIRLWRKGSGMNLRECAKRLEINYTYLSKIESGAMPPPSDETINKLAFVLDASEATLFRLAGRLPPHLRIVAARSAEVVALIRTIEPLSDHEVYKVVEYARTLRQQDNTEWAPRL